MKNRTTAIFSRLCVLAAIILPVSPVFPADITDDFESPKLDAGYETVIGQWTVSNGQLLAISRKISYLIKNGDAVDTTAPMTVAADFLMGAPGTEKGAIGLFAGYKATNIYTQVRFRAGAINTVQLLDCKEDKSKTTQLPQSEALKPDVWYRLTVKSSGKGKYDIRLVARDTPEHVVASGTLSGSVVKGKVGFASYGEISSRFDNFCVTTE